jgi:hypothetical protein
LVLCKPPIDPIILPVRGPDVTAEMRAVDLDLMATSSTLDMPLRRI